MLPRIVRMILTASGPSISFKTLNDICVRVLTPRSSIMQII
jgi:hypothetical protein